MKAASHPAAAQLTFQAVPFHRSIKVLPAPTLPTAQALVAETAATADRAARPPGVGLGTLVHLTPFHCAIRVVMAALAPTPFTVPPTAQALVADKAATPARMPPGAPRPGLGVCAQALPCHPSINGPLNPLGVAQVVQPTAQALLAETAATPRRVSGLGNSGLGLATCFHAVPFHRKINVLVMGPVKPTAHALPAESAATPARPAPPAGLGLGTCFHAAPFHRKISVLGLPPVLVEPTAQALLAETAATPERLEKEPGCGAGTCAQAVPFHRSIRALPVLVEPTAQALVADVAATPARVVPAGAGLGACFQLVPFQCTISG